MKIAEDPPAAQPEWLLTYGDLMTLLLTIFVMLVSMGELKQTDKFQGVADSLHEQFGGSESRFGLATGGLRPRNSMLAAAAVAFRFQRTAAIGSLTSAEPGSGNGVAADLQFAEASAELTDEHRLILRNLAAALAGKPHPIEVRGHAVTPDGQSSSGDAWELAYRRARATVRFLVDELQIEESRIRLMTTGSAATKHHGAVEVVLLEVPPAQP